MTIKQERTVHKKAIYRLRDADIQKDKHTYRKTSIHTKRQADKKTQTKEANRQSEKQRATQGRNKKWKEIAFDIGRRHITQTYFPKKKETEIVGSTNQENRTRDFRFRLRPTFFV